jgi:hypothetical protein
MKKRSLKAVQRKSRQAGSGLPDDVEGDRPGARGRVLSSWRSSPREFDCRWEDAASDSTAASPRWAGDPATHSQADAHERTPTSGSWR